MSAKAQAPARVNTLSVSRSQNQQVVVDDVARIRHHPLVPATIPICGYIYDVKSGRLIEVEDATRAGRANSVTEVESTRAVTA
jgi:carbonic anhydrase